MADVTDHAKNINDQVQIRHEEEEKEEDQEISNLQPQQQQLNSKNLRRYDSLDIESAKVHGADPVHSRTKGMEWAIILQLAFQSLGVVYGDIGTSPLYVYAGTFTEGIKHNDDILGVLSLIYYTITLIPLIKYVFIVLRATDNGDGGTFALYSLLCRYAKVGLIPSQEAADRDVSTFKLELPSNRLRRASMLKAKLEKSEFAKLFLLFATMLGTSMVIGDGVLTPCISVLSAVGGIKEATSVMTEGRIVWVSAGILIVLFSVQRFGTDKVGYTFAPIICIWLFFNASIGFYNFFHHDTSVIKAINPWYIFKYFQRNKKAAWISLGGVVLSTTGTEALFADVGHFSVKSIQISMCSVVYPAILLSYTGQASYLRKNSENVANVFFKSLPGPMYWPTFVVSVLAAIIASQALISGTFSIIQQSISLGCFPRVKIVHTSAKYQGQVYIPEVNYLLMVACVCVTLGFRTTAKIGNAYGIAVVFVMTLTSGFLVLIMIIIWKTNILIVITYVLIIGSVELLYLSSVLYKFDQGGYLPLVFAMFLMGTMFVWNDVYRRKYYYELQNKISPEKVKEMANDSNCVRMPGLAIFYSELVQGIPPIFKHYVGNVPALHSVLVFVSIKSLPISRVPPEERFLFRRINPRELSVFRCVVRYGYTDARNEDEPFEKLLVERLKEFVKEDGMFLVMSSGDEDDQGENYNEEEWREDGREKENEREVELLNKAWLSGVVHLVGESDVVAGKGAGVVKSVLIESYNFLKRNLRQTEKMFDIPHQRMLKVGMTYEL
ncbi:potassium transporter 5-like [Impatiens glandulifera]|uniref:potassium transporter 5-like n=1 Tax=Impatiens glandulifera TaxID=253017 RepID=UPI001FB18706|nr:potassium transporter 5-like [Impatiens glandulifera]